MVSKKDILHKLTNLVDVIKPHHDNQYDIHDKSKLGQWMEDFRIVSYVVASIAILYCFILIANMSFLIKYNTRLYVFKSLIPTLVFVTAMVFAVYLRLTEIQKTLFNSKLKISEDLVQVNKCLVKIAQIDASYYEEGLKDLIQTIDVTLGVLFIQVIGGMISVLIYLFTTLCKKYQDSEFAEDVDEVFENMSQSVRSRVSKISVSKHSSANLSKSSRRVTRHKVRKDGKLSQSSRVSGSS